MKVDGREKDENAQDRLVSLRAWKIKPHQIIRLYQIQVESITSFTKTNETAKNY